MATRLAKDTTFVRQWVPPTSRRLDADPRYCGRGVTIAFLDAGFHPHPDLLYPSNRIAAYVDVTSDEEPLCDKKAMIWNWHGTMTSVIAAGSGYLSAGYYSGLARQSKVVLVKVSKGGGIARRNLALGLRWVIENRERYNIRIVNISLGVGQRELESKDSLVDFWVKRAVDEGMVVVAAAGNDGGAVSSPAKAPEAITVGGYYDHVGELYNSSHGITPDGVHKPDLVAPAALIASPILLNTPQQARAQALVRLLNDTQAPLKDLMVAAELDPRAPELSLEDLRSEIQGRVAGQKVVTPFYEHADGTSVAAPLVSSIIAQMLEADPGLTPAAVRSILVGTATRLESALPFRQGHGVVSARRAVAAAADRRHPLRLFKQLGPVCRRNKVVFLFHAEQAAEVRLAGDFNDWDPEKGQLETQPTGLWKAVLKAPPPGRYRYKFLIDGSRWLDDPWNVHKEPDNLGGMHSILEVG